MKGQVFNPYLPSWEYIPDGEPHVFDGRVYVYGSHDRFDGKGFCLNDYVTWSAPVDDLSDWRYEGVIYKKTDDPHYRGRGNMYAPDVCRAPDGKYYLYYGFTPFINRKSWAIRCAVSDSPAGPFKYHGEVDLYKYSKKYLPFDPAVYVEDGRVWLYYGSGMFFPVAGVCKSKVCGAVAELDPSDMLTLKGEPKTTMPCVSGELGGHGFFEASSMRKINGRYYFVYSSLIGHELCYAVGDRPDGPFRYGGTLVSNGDIGLNGHTNPKTASNYTGNTHGGILSIGDRHYIFYHRQTNRHCFSRQDCAEEIKIQADGSIKQVEMTSCGLNGGPLRGKGVYDARIACNLTSKKGCRFQSGPFGKNRKGCHPYFTQSGKDREGDGDQYIANVSDGAVVGFKYFDIAGLKRIGVTVCGKASGEMQVCTEPEGLPVAIIKISPCKTQTVFYGDYTGGDGVKALYFKFSGRGALTRFMSIVLD